MTIHAQLAPVEAATASPSQRTITGLAVPFGPVGHTGMGAITFAAGALRWDPANLGRVKLLRQHDQGAAAVGYATALTEEPGGLRATFAIPDGPDGDQALTEAAEGRRDGLSVGVQLDPEILAQVIDKYLSDDMSPTAAAGQLVEVSTVTIPAFDDARADGSAAENGAPRLAASAPFHVKHGGRPLARMSVSFTPLALEPPWPGLSPSPVALATATKENPMTVQTPAPAPAPAEVDQPSTTPAAPAPSAVAGSAAAHVSDPAVYQFNGSGDSFVRDVFRAKIDMNRDAMDRLDRFSGAMRGSSPAQMAALMTAAVEDRTSAPNYIQQGYKPELLISAIDKGRPLNSRISSSNLTDATPYRLPVEGDFTGVATHTEGTAHATEGDLTMGEVVITPGAISGAYRLSRELIDASNPALDAIAIRAMTRNYQAVTEARLVAALLAADATATFNIDTVLELSAQLNTFYDVGNEEASFVALSPSLYATFAANVAGDGRPFLAPVNPVNTVGTRPPGSTGAHVEGVELVKSSAIAATDGYIVNAADIHVGESSLMTFRFDEVEGPGIIKLALWAYYVAAVLRSTSVVQISSAAS